MFLDAGSVEPTSELSLTTVIIKMKDNQRKSFSTEVYLRIFNLIVDLTPLFNAVIVLDRRNLRI